MKASEATKAIFQMARLHLFNAKDSDQVKSIRITSDSVLFQVDGKCSDIGLHWSRDGEESTRWRNGDGDFIGGPCTLLGDKSVVAAALTGATSIVATPFPGGFKVITYLEDGSSILRVY